MSAPLSIDAAVADAIERLTQAASPVPRLVYTAAEVAAALTVSRSMVYTLIRRQGLPAFRVGTDVRIPVAQLTAWVTDQMEQQRKDGAA